MSQRNEYLAGGLVLVLFGVIPAITVEPWSGTAFLIGGLGAVVYGLTRSEAGKHR